MNITSTTNIFTHPYTNPTINNKIAKIHDELSGHFYNVVAPSLDMNIEEDLLTPLDILCFPTANGIPNINLLTLRQIQDALLTNSTPVQWNLFGVYNKVQCAVMAKIHEFIWAIKYFLKIDLTQHPKENDLQRIGTLANSASTTLAAKILWLYYVEYTETVGAKGTWFFGNASVTRPVRDFFAKIYSIYNISQGEATAMTHNIAYTCQMDPLSVNTAMWIMGR